MEETGLVPKLGAEEATEIGVEDGGGDLVFELVVSANGDEDIARAMTLTLGDADVCTLNRACQLHFSYIHCSTLFEVEASDSPVVIRSGRSEEIKGILQYGHLIAVATRKETRGRARSPCWYAQATRFQLQQLWLYYSDPIRGGETLTGNTE